MIARAKRSNGEDHHLLPITVFQPFRLSEMALYSNKVAGPQKLQQKDISVTDSPRSVSESSNSEAPVGEIGYMPRFRVEESSELRRILRVERDGRGKKVTLASTSVR